jgi:hypothetical protein
MIGEPSMVMSMIPPQERSTRALPIIGISAMPASITCSTIGRFPRAA